jgi:hypothetical protein
MASNNKNTSMPSLQVYMEQEEYDYVIMAAKKNARSRSNYLRLLVQKDMEKNNKCNQSLIV